MHVPFMSIVAILCAAGCGRIGFDSQVVDDAGPLPDSASRADAVSGADVDAAASQGVTSLLASTTCGGASQSVSIGAAGVPQGSLLLVQVVRRNDAGPVTISDSRGNVYELLSSVGPSGLTIDLFETSLVVALEAGDTIDAVHGNANASSMIVVELQKLVATPVEVSTAFASDGNFSVSFSPHTSGLVYCAGAIREGQIQLDPRWLPIANLATDCGSANGISSNFAFATAADGMLGECAGSVELQNGFQQWVAAALNYADAP